MLRSTGRSLRSSVGTKIALSQPTRSLSQSRTTIVHAAPSEPAGGDPSEAARDREDAARANLASVEEAFAAEPVDGAWAVQARSIVQDRLGAVSRASSSALGAVDCHASICRVEIAHRDLDAARQFAEKAFVGSGEPAWNGPVMVAPPEVHADGSLAAIMYLCRRDTSLVRQAR